MKLILTSDWHLDDNPQNEYRWGVFSTVRNWIRQDDVAGVLNLGDLGHKKDKHNGILVNRMTSEVCKLRDAADGKAVHFLEGNHDYVDPENPFFGFLGQIPGVEFHTETTPWEFPYSRGVRRFLFVPHQASWGKRAPLRMRDDIATTDMLLAHRTFKGAIASTGTRMDGYSRPEKQEGGHRFPPVVSGDIHVPQDLGQVTYVGSPHPVAFGDHFAPRMLSLDLESLELTTIPMHGLQRLSLDFAPSPDGAAVQTTTGVTIQPGDHVKVRYNAPRSELGRWSEVQTDIRALIEQDLQATLFDLTYVCTDDDVATADLPKDSAERELSNEVIFETFCKAFGVPHEYRIPGRELMR